MVLRLSISKSPETPFTIRVTIKINARGRQLLSYVIEYFFFDNGSSDCFGLFNLESSGFVPSSQPEERSIVVLTANNV